MAVNPDFLQALVERNAGDKPISGLQGVPDPREAAPAGSAAEGL
jgi:hypothetical protein